jgi:hypothetical protein
MLLRLVASSPLAAYPGEAPVRRLPRDQLLLYRTPQGPRRARTIAHWKRRRAEILAAFHSIAGPFPGEQRRCPLDVSVEEETDCGEFVRQLVRYQAEPEARVRAYLLIPKQALSGARVPGVLCLHQTRPAGNTLVVGLAGSPDDEYGVELARRGHVCLAPPYPLLAEYHPDLAKLGYASGTMKAVWDNIRGLDLLDSLPYVRPGVFAAIGHSLGGHNAIFTAIHDDRIRVVATSCAFDSFLDYMNGEITGWTHARYMPRLLAYKGRPSEVPFDFHELIGALAPRGVFISAPTGDTNFNWRSVDRVTAAAREVYRLYRASNHLVVRHPDCPHRFPPFIREEAYAFIERHLRVDR